MEEKNKSSSPDNSTPEIPSNSPPPEAEPVRARAQSSRVSEGAKHRQRMNGVKLAYAFALLIAFGGALVARLVAEDSLSPIEGDYVISTPSITSAESVTQVTEPDFQVRHNVTDVPDTREEAETTKPSTTAEPTTEGSEFAVPYKDYYTLPLGTDILKDYSPTTPSYNATMGDWRTHGGVDFKGPDGSQVKAISYGTVTDISDDPLYGTVITIDHGNEVVAKYCGLNKDVNEVSEGDKVKSGQLLGYLGEIPCEKADVSHLHLEVYYKGENVDPLALMSK